MNNQSHIYAFGKRFQLWGGGSYVNIYGDICWIFNRNGEIFTYYKGDKTELTYKL